MCEFCSIAKAVAKLKDTLYCYKVRLINYSVESEWYKTDWSDSDCVSMLDKLKRQLAKFDAFELFWHA